VKVTKTDGVASPGLLPTPSPDTFSSDSCGGSDLFSYDGPDLLSYDGPDPVLTFSRMADSGPSLV
jgi:hypothetical protein